VVVFEFSESVKVQKILAEIHLNYPQVSDFKIQALSSTK